MADVRAAYDFMQSEMSPVQKVAQDNIIRETQKPRVPPQPALTTTTFQDADGSVAASVTVTWSPVRKDLDYQIRWKLATDTNYTYDSCRFTASATQGVHILRPLPTNVSINVGLASDYRTTGSRSEFVADVTITTAKKTTPDAVPTGLAITALNRTDASSPTISAIWNNNSEQDLAYYNLQENGSSVLKALTTQWTKPSGNIALGTTYTYKIASVDKTGNQSAFSSGVNGVSYYTGSAPGMAGSASGSTSFPGQLSILSTATNIDVSGMRTIQVNYTYTISNGSGTLSATMVFTVGTQSATKTDINLLAPVYGAGALTINNTQSGVKSCQWQLTITGFGSGGGAANFTGSGGTIS